MKKFNKLVQQILQSCETLPNTFNINNVSNICTPTYKWFNTYEILNEYIQKLNNKGKRCTIKSSAGITFYIQYKIFFDIIFNHNITNNLLQFINYILKDKEQDTLVKHVLEYFQLMYEYEIPEKLDNLKDRLIWLNKKLTNLENQLYYQSNEWKDNLNLIKQNYDTLSSEEQIKFNFIHAELGYLICNKILTNKKVKEKLINYFNKFTYREF